MRLQIIRTPRVNNESVKQSCVFGVSITNDDFIICTVHSGVVIDHWPSLRQHGLFTNANQWRARMAKHGSVYRSWDASDFTVRMLLQKWRADLSSFWDNGSWALTGAWPINRPLITMHD